MKNTTLFFFLIVFILSSMSFAQYYVKLEGGYNLSLNSVNIGYDVIYNPGDYTYEAVTGSFGKGVNFSGTFGYDFCSNLGLELGLIYKLSNEFEQNVQGPNGNISDTWNGSFFGFTPTFVINAPLEKIKLFAKIGLLIALPTSEIEIVNNSGETQRATFSSGTDFGLSGGAGVLVPLSSKIDFIAEFVFVSFTWKPNEVEQTYFDGTTETIKLEDEFNSNNENTQGPVFIPFSNVGLNVGVKINF
jgi:opacity protein-like surface antigen